MKDKNIMVQIELIGAIIRDEVNAENGIERNCRLQDANEYLARAYAVLAGVTRSDNDTTIEMANA